MKIYTSIYDQKLSYTIDNKDYSIVREGEILKLKFLQLSNPRFSVREGLDGIKNFRLHYVLESDESDIGFIHTEFLKVYSMLDCVQQYENEFITRVKAVYLVPADRICLFEDE